MVVEEELGLPVTRRGPWLGDVPLVPHGGYVGQKEFHFNRTRAIIFVTLFTQHINDHLTHMYVCSIRKSHRAPMH